MSKSKTANTDLAAVLSQQQKQSKIINALKRQNRWTIWLGVIILIILLLTIFTLGYASNWWQDPIRTSQLIPTSEQASEVGTNGTNASNATEATTNKTDTSTNTNTTNRSDTSTNQSTTTTTKETVTNNAGGGSDTSNSNLQILLDEIALGSNIDDVKARASELGIAPECNTVLLIVQECAFTVGGNSISTKNLLSDDLLTGISSNF